MRVQQAGRLGNFLFQWAFALYLAQELDSKVSITFDKYHSDFEVLATNRHLFQTQSVKLMNSPITGLECKFLDYLSSTSEKLGRSISSKLLVEHEGGTIKSGALRLYRGYFQDVKYPNAVKKDVMNILQSKIDQVNRSSHVRSRFPVLLGHYQAIHLRLGDFKGSSFGVLRLKNQLELLNPNMPLVILTDGSKEEILARISGVNATILTPSDSNPWETLDVMSKARRVITSNSTMSWWGGYIANTNEAEVFLPDSWRKSDEPSSKLHIPGTNTYVAQYE